MPTPIRTLVIDSATEACSVALFDGDTRIAHEWRMLGRGHAEQLVPMIAGLPDLGRADRIAVSLGPGSFTGVRVGLAAARALAFAWSADLLGYPTLALVAAIARAEHAAEPLAVVMAGGHGEWFVQRFAGAGGALGPAGSRAPDLAVAGISERLVAGSAARAAVSRRGHGEALELWPDAGAFALLAPDLLSADVRPAYGRAPDAKLPQAAA